MTKPISFDDLKLLDFRNSDNEPIWFYMNHYFFQDHYLKLFSEKEMVKETVRDSSKIHAIVCLGKMMLHNLKWVFNFKKTDVVYYVPSRNAKVNGKYLNQYSDHFAMLYPNNSLTLENAPTDWTYNMPRVNNKTIFYGPSLAICSVLTKFDKSEVKSIQGLIDYIDDKCGECLEKRFTAQQKQMILKDTVYQMQRIRLHAKWLVHICRKHKAKLFAMVGGSYQYYYAINRLMKDNGIKTAELQHGYIFSNSLYNLKFEELLKRPETKIATPDYLLTYGSYWCEQANLPYERKVVVGNPYRDMKIQSFDYNRPRKNILLIGCNHDARQYIQLGNELQEKLPDYQVIFRPHPIERITVKELLKTVEVKCTLDFDADLYLQLEKCVVVASEVSTVLYESEGLADHILAWRTPYGKECLQDCPFEEFESADNLIKIIKNGVSKNIETGRFYAKDYKAKYMEFIEEEVK